MTQSEIEEIEREQQHIADMAGMIDFNHFFEFKYRAIKGMLKFGGNFVQALAGALQYADNNNAVKIMRTWRAEVREHELLWRILEAKQKAANVLAEESEFDPKN